MVDRIRSIFPRKHPETITTVLSPDVEDRKQQANELKLEIERTRSLLESFLTLAPRDLMRSNGNYDSKSLKVKFKSIGDEQYNAFLESIGKVLSDDSNGRVGIAVSGRSGWEVAWTDINIGWNGKNKVFLRINNDSNKAHVSLVLEGCNFIPAPQKRGAFGQYTETLELVDQVRSNQVLEVLVSDLQDSHAAWQDGLQQQKAAYFEDLRKARGEGATSAVNSVIEALTSQTKSGEEYIILGQNPEKTRKRKNKPPITLYTTLDLTDELTDIISRNMRTVATQNLISLTINYFGTLVEVKYTETLFRDQDYYLKIQFLNFIYGNEETSQKFTLIPEPKRDHVEARLLYVNPPTVQLDVKSGENTRYNRWPMV